MKTWRRAGSNYRDAADCRASSTATIDYSDIPSLTGEQLAQFRRTPKVLVAAGTTGVYKISSW